MPPAHSPNLDLLRAYAVLTVYIGHLFLTFHVEYITSSFMVYDFAQTGVLFFFVHTSLSWAIDHQYGFLAEILSGEKLYFGDRPRNAHHWMVISDELFDYREELMQRCLEEFGLSELDRAEWRAIEEVFRGQIVKDAPIPRKRHGVALPLEGYGELELSGGGLCDDCQGAIAIGTTVKYHLRTGKTYCPACFSRLEAAP